MSLNILVLFFKLKRNCMESIGTCNIILYNNNNNNINLIAYVTLRRPHPICGKFMLLWRAHGSKIEVLMTCEYSSPQRNCNKN